MRKLFMPWQGYYSFTNPVILVVAAWCKHPVESFKIVFFGKRI